MSWRAAAWSFWKPDQASPRASRVCRWAARAPGSAGPEAGSVPRVAQGAQEVQRALTGQACPAVPLSAVQPGHDGSPQTVHDLRVLRGVVGGPERIVVRGNQLQQVVIIALAPRGPDQGPILGLDAENATDLLQATLMGEGLLAQPGGGVRPRA